MLYINFFMNMSRILDFIEFYMRVPFLTHPVEVYSLSLLWGEGMHHPIDFNIRLLATQCLMKKTRITRNAVLHININMYSRSDFLAYFTIFSSNR